MQLNLRSVKLVLRALECLSTLQKTRKKILGRKGDACKALRGTHEMARQCDCSQYQDRRCARRFGIAEKPGPEKRKASEPISSKKAASLVTIKRFC